MGPEIAPTGGLLMKNRSWSRIVALLAVLMLAFAACGEDEGGGGGGGGGGQAGPQFETIKEGVLQVGSCLDYKPFEFIKGGEETGFDVELTDAIADELGLEVQWVRADFDTIFSAVAAQKFDMVAAASTITPERQQTVDFSDPYYASRQALTVNTNERPDIKSTDDIGEGDIIGVQKGTTGAAYAKENLVPQGAEIKTFTTTPDDFTDLEAGNVDAILNDEPSSAEEVKTRPGLEVVQPIDTDENYGFAFSKENPDLTRAVNDALQAVIDAGTYAEIFEKYFPGVEVPEDFAAQ
jgi:polar amino acid transport system substrate-binding protein